MPVSEFRVSAVIVITCLLVAGCAPAPSTIETPASEQVSLADYRRAESFLNANTSALVANSIQALHWQEDDRLVYQRSTEQGSDFILVNPATDSKTILFDTERLVSALSAYSDEDINSRELSLSKIELSDDLETLRFEFEDVDYILNLGNYVLEKPEASPPDEFLSPDESKAAFIGAHNLWVRDTASNELTQLTFDGEEDYGYATNNAGWVKNEAPVLLWSPDSSKIATFRHDGRNVGDMYLYSTQVGHPELDAWKYPLPGDDHIFMIERVVIHLDPEPRMLTLNMPPDPQRSTTTDHIAGNGGIFLDVEWSDDSENLAFVSSSRDHKVAQLRVANPDTGEVRDVHKEEVQTYFESGFDSANWRVFHERGEFLWFSEGDNWGHLYLHDLQTGELKQQLTSGSWSVLQVQYIDLENEQIYFLASNREAGDPYYHYLYRINMDGSELENLTPENANHVITWSESREYFVDIYSTPTQPARSVIRTTSGESIMALEQEDIGALLASGWVAPIPFTVKARDQITDLYGLMYKPSNFDESQLYPVLNYLYPGPQTGSVGSRSFQASRRDKQALAELGFIVVEVDAMGTPGRSKAFHDAYYGNMGDNGLPDQITAIRQLAADNSWMDLDRIGIWGHSGGGFASTAGILRYPDFYKVAVSSAGNHDNRNYEDDWGEKWQGLLETYPESDPLQREDEEAVAATNYDNQANQLLVENLQGKLLLAHGLLDNNVHPSNTLIVVQALIEAEKDFDLVLLPNATHRFGNSRYFMKRRWDYFVEHLRGAMTPSDFSFADNIR